MTKVNPTHEKIAEQRPILYLSGVSVSFDGFKALNALSFFVDQGEMRAIIGPNGAGKTTMMDVITGKTRPDEGDVFFEGDIDLTRQDEAAIAGFGIGRKFQKPTVFESHDVQDNLMLALPERRTPWSALFGVGERQDRLDEVLQTIGLTERRLDLGGDLSHGQKQWLEIGMLLCQDPKLLLVDEPVAGMTDAETEQTASLLRHIAKDHSVVVVEHDMAFIRDLDVKVTVLHEGSVLAEGSLDQVSAEVCVFSDGRPASTSSTSTSDASVIRTSLTLDASSPSAFLPGSVCVFPDGVSEGVSSNMQTSSPKAVRARRNSGWSDQRAFQTVIDNRNSAHLAEFANANLEDAAGSPGMVRSRNKKKQDLNRSQWRSSR